MTNGLIDFGAVRPNAAMDAYQQGQQNQLAQLQLSQAQQAAQDAEAERNAWKGASNYGEVQQRLMQQGLGKQALAVGAAQTKAQADKIAMLKGTTELLSSTAKKILADPSTAVQDLVEFGKQTGHDVSKDLAEVQALNGDPEKIRLWAAGHAISADKLLPHFETRDLGGTVETRARNPVTGAVIGTPEVRNKTMAPGESQRIGLERERVNLAQDEARLRREGIEGIAPKELQKREAALPAATSAIKGFEAKSDSFIQDLQKLRDHPGLSQITGVAAGRLPALTSEGRAAQALYDKIVAKGGFQALQDLRDASKTGGALGNVSNQEGKQLSASFAAIQRTQDAKDVQAATDQAIGDVQGAKTRMRAAYDSTYSYKRPAANGVIDFGSLK
jgi:hypothetical protein